ncbi:calcium-dependent protein kinase, putative [Plasmodium sp. gorilla clade G2]|uniref:calcium-dependent protein kinase, putative n=1 Tax=Plasmodium sp. gorilla clade G2 TaxID=880535 RepID=UPI000D21A627|nr:calcium-dependent protein kinase, putative [Plasmodium sp. gorilla clade G2]SOV18981.1 calcium-dependent protein kinase, putative [Plasmodium sp. gorilla clade G2]SOV82662.1 calcium-dependent protein kinase, putative [Plasmodium sp. gorilla clade G3]SPJ12627.1 calcium-dependent protein kinase, putative [Plasmodium sp. DRC-Itaito]
MGNALNKLLKHYRNVEKKKNEYKFGKILGCGSFGVVRECINKMTKEVYAVKIIKKKKKHKKSYNFEKMVKNEIKYLSIMSHENIIKFKDFFEDKNKFYIVLEKCEGGELFYKVVKNKCLMESESALIVRQICCALQYLHSNNIIHRDIKAENFLFKNKNTKNIKLIDFGMAKRVNCEYLTELCGSPHYISPELIRKKYTMSSDIWALGVMVFFMLTGKYPFEGKNTPKVVDEILNKNINWKGKEFSSLSIEAVDFLKRLLERNEKKRLTAYQALNHPWITSQVG